VDWVRPELLVKDPMWITNTWQNIVVNFHQDIMANTLSNFILRQMDSGPLYWPNHCRKEKKKKTEHVSSGNTFSYNCVFLLPGFERTVKQSSGSFF
jgi:hypothetical protein